MPPVLLLLIERLVLSPTVQQAAWDMIKPYLENDTLPPEHVIAEADRAADAAHRAITDFDD